MSQDGRPQVVPGSVHGRRRVDVFFCSCGGTVLRTQSPFTSCNSCGAPHCTKCLRPARRFRKGLTCGVGCVRV